MKHFIFDLDGTLIDTEQAVLNTWQKTLADYGYHFSLAELRAVLGVTTETGLSRLNAQVDSEFVPRWQDNYTAFAKETSFFPGTREMLLTLRDKGCDLGIVSSRDCKEYQAFFSQFGLDKLFGTVILAEDTVRHKPDPDPILQYLKVTGAEPDQCIYIGDMPGDIICANRSGIASGLALWNQSGIVCPDARYRFSHVEDVLQLV